MTAPQPSLAAAAPCPTCGTQVASTLLACPACRALVHRDALERLSAAAREAEARGDAVAALEAWRDALALLPADSRQHATVTQRVDALVASLAGSTTSPAGSGKGGRRLGVVGAGVAAALFLLGKGKLLVLGLTKLPTLLSMFAALGVYWAIFGWRWAVGIIVGLYIHELGHVAALARYGVRATALMFVPGLGAFVSYKRRLPDPRQEARVALAGPLWGLGAGLASLALARLTGHEWFAAVGAVTGLINLFNLIPITPLDGGHAFPVLGQAHRLGIAGALAAMAWLRGDQKSAWLVGLVALVIGALAFYTPPAKEPDRGAFIQFLGIALALGWLATAAVTTVP